MGFAGYGKTPLVSQKSRHFAKGGPMRHAGAFLSRCFAM